MPKISARKLILCELLRLHFKRNDNNDNINKRKRFFVQQIWKETRRKSFKFWLRN